MAIKKIISETRYLYAVIRRVEYEKNRAKCVFVFTEEREIEENSLIHRDEFAFQPLDSEQSYFQIETLDGAGENVVRAAYLWLKTHKPIFQGWEDA